MNFKRQYAALGIPDCPEGAFEPEGKKLRLHGGGGGGAPANTTTTTIPEYARPYVENMLGAAQGNVYNFDANSQITGVRPLQQYQGKLTAESSPLQEQSYLAASGMRSPDQFNQATRMAQQAGNTGLAALNATQGYDPASFSGGQWGAAQRDQYMSPYMQGVVDISKNQAMRDAAAQGTQRAAKFSQAGAFGGSRQAIADAEASRNLNQQMQDIQTKGMQDAYTTGMSAFQSDAARNLQAQQLGEQSRQYGAGLGLQGIQAAGQMQNQAASTLNQIGAQQAQSQQEIAKLQNQFGQQQQQTAQQAIDAQMQQWAQAQNAPYKQLGFLSDMLRGLPLSNSSVYQASPSPTSQLAGMGLAGLGLYNSMKS